MTTASERLDELGITLPPVVPPVAAYIPARFEQGLVYTSGQLPMRDGELLATGHVGDQISPEEAKDLARVCCLNAIAAAASVAGGIDSITGVVKVVGFVASAAGFIGQPGVINGASELLLEVFGESGRHARSAVGVAELPLGAPVEVELIFSTAR